MSKVRINDLARELEVKSKAILDVLSEVGVIEKKTHSSSLEEDEAERVRRHFAGQAGHGGAGTERRGKGDEVRPKFDFSKISKPGDVLRAIKKPAAAPEPPPVPKPMPPAIATPPKAGVAIPKSAVPPRPVV